MTYPAIKSKQYNGLCFCIFPFKGRIDIRRMSSNYDIVTKFKVMQNPETDPDIRCADKNNGIICDNAISDYTYNFTVCSNKILTKTFSGFFNSFEIYGRDY